MTLGGRVGWAQHWEEKTAHPQKLALLGHDPSCWRELGPTQRSISALFWVKNLDEFLNLSGYREGGWMLTCGGELSCVL